MRASRLNLLPITLGLAAGEILRRSFFSIDLRGRVVLITGGSRGLGFLLAREFARQGARVAICARDTEELSRAVARIKTRGADAIAIPCDLSREDSAHRLVDEVIARFGHLDILVNNAGIMQVGPFESMSREDFRQTMETNFWGTLRVSAAALPALRRSRRARIVNITSIGAAISAPHILPYSCSKFSQLALSLGLRSELAKDGVRVVTILPGLMRTGSTVNALFKGHAEQEFRLFSLSDSIPLLTMGAERAARQIVRATRYGTAFLTLGVPFKLTRVLYALAPGLFSDLFGTVALFLPKAGTQDRRREAEPGSEFNPRRGLLEWVLVRAANRKGASEYNQPKRTA